MSSDLSPIENLWIYIGRAVASRHPSPKDINALVTPFLEEWTLIPQTVVNIFTASLKMRCNICVQVRGDHILY